MARNLLFFTSAYPGGTNESFVANEIKYLSDVFDSITLVPFRERVSGFYRDLPENVVIEPPLLQSDAFSNLLLRGILNKSPVFPFFRDLLRKKSFSPRNLTRWGWYSLATRAMLATPFFKSLANHPPQNTIAYFYWGFGCSMIVPFIPRNGMPIAVRFHKADLYEWLDDRYYYLPLRQELLERLDKAIFISENGLKYLKNQYSEISFDSILSRLGVEQIETKPYEQAEALRIVSCSRVAPEKRLDLIVETLRKVKRPIHWTHFGGGDEFEDLRRKTRELPDHVTVDLKGQTPNQAVIDFYKENSVDLFLNVSLIEGVPVSIMEALAAGVPIFATDTGGTAELVDDQVGELLSGDITADQLSRRLDDFLHKNPELKRANAVKRWRERCDAEILYPRLAKDLVSLLE